MAIQVTGFFPNQNNDSYIKDAVITLNINQVPMGKLDVTCNLNVEKEITNPIGEVSTQLVMVSSFVKTNIDRTSLTFTPTGDPYEDLLSSVQDYLISLFETENPDLTFSVYGA